MRWKDGIIQTSLVVALETIKEPPPPMVEGSNHGHLRNRPPPLPTFWYNWINFKMSSANCQSFCPSLNMLTHLPLVPHYAYMCQWTGSVLVQIMACCLYSAKPLSEPMLVYCQLDPKNEFQRISNQNTKLFIHANAFENIVCEMAAILSRGRCVNSLMTAINHSKFFHNVLTWVQNLQKGWSAYFFLKFTLLKRLSSSRFRMYNNLFNCEVFVSCVNNVQDVLQRGICWIIKCWNGKNINKYV